jgi:hypothetical protein
MTEYEKHKKEEDTKILVANTIPKNNPIPNQSPAKFHDYRSISFLVCLSKVFEVLMVRYRSTAAADRSTADFSQAFDMVVHGLLLCNLRNAQNYSVGAGMLGHI